MNNRGFIFEAIQRWPVTNLVTLIQGYSYLVSLEIVVGFRKLRSFQEAQVNLSVILDKPDITYDRTLNRESLEPSCGISRKNQDHAEKLYFSGDHQFFQISQGIKSIHDWGRKLIHFLVGEDNLGPGRQFQQIYGPGCTSPGHVISIKGLTVKYIQPSEYIKLFFINTETLF